MSPHLDDLQTARLAEGALPGPEGRTAAAHAEACPACAARVESHRALLAALDGLAAPDAPAGFTDRVMAEVDRRERNAARERRAALAVGAAALAALVASALAAGPPPWIPAAARTAEQIAALASALRLGADVLPGLLGSLRLPLAAACAAVALPMLLLLPRLAAAPRRKTS